jgi:hypothetical protein
MEHWIDQTTKSFSSLGISIEGDAAGISIPAFISVCYRSIPVPDWSPYSGTGLVPASKLFIIPVTD